MDTRRGVLLLWDPLALGSPLRFAARPWTGTVNFEEEQIYIGILPWALLLAGLVRVAGGRARLASDDVLRIASLAAVAGVAAALGLGWWPIHDLLTRIPPFGNASNPRMLFLAQVAVPVVAALLWRAAPRPGASAVARPALATFLLAGVVSGTAALAWLAIDERWALRPWVGLASAATLLAADRIAATAATRRLVAVAIPIMLLIDVGAVYIGYHPQVPRQWRTLRVRNILPPNLQDPHPRLARRVRRANLALYGVVDITATLSGTVRYDAHARRPRPRESATLERRISGAE
jgi:hypothetical protein